MLYFLPRKDSISSAVSSQDAHFTPQLFGLLEVLCSSLVFGACCGDGGGAGRVPKGWLLPFNINERFGWHLPKEITFTDYDEMLEDCAKLLSVRCHGIMGYIDNSGPHTQTHCHIFSSD